MNQRETRQVAGTRSNSRRATGLSPVWCE